MTHAEAQSHFDAYADAFQRRDWDAIADVWAYPCMISDQRGGYAFRDRDGFRRNLERLGAFYAAQGVVGAAAQVRDVDAEYDGVARVRVDYRLTDASGETIIAWPTDYVLRQQTDGRWTACFGIADGEMNAWAARGTPMGKST